MPEYVQSVFGGRRRLAPGSRREMRTQPETRTYLRRAPTQRPRWWCTEHGICPLGLQQCVRLRVVMTARVLEAAVIVWVWVHCVMGSGAHMDSAGSFCLKMGVPGSRVSTWSNAESSGLGLWLGLGSEYGVGSEGLFRFGVRTMG